LGAAGTLLAQSDGMHEPIALNCVGSVSAPASGTAALDLAEAPSVTMQFTFSGAEDLSLEAIRHARRAMLREEWTRGRESGEPSLEEAVFSATGVVWVAAPEEQEWCLRKMDELVARANRALAMLAPR
jgi:hypothetical protein